MARRRREAVLQSCRELEEFCPQFKTEEALAFAKDSGTLYKAHVMRVLWQYGLAGRHVQQRLPLSVCTAPGAGPHPAHAPL